MNNKLTRLNKLSEKRIQYFLSKWDEMSWYKWSKTYWENVKWEIQEAENEINSHQVYLEDELGDVLWDYLCLLNSLKNEWKITSVEKIFDRALTKFSGRINEKTGDYNGKWEDIKEKQKKDIEDEINNNK